MRRTMWPIIALLALVVVAVPVPASHAAVDPATGADEGTPSRFGVRTVDGVGELYVVDSGERFVPRGANYVDFVRDEEGRWRDAVFATASYDPARVRAAFRTMASLGYDTARIFFDTCGIGASCIGLSGGIGLRPGYLDNIVDVMRIAAEEGIYLMLTANTIPDDGGYWEEFDRIFDRGHEGFSGRENADWLHTAGVEVKARFWDDLLSGLAERDAPFEAVLGWQLTNEQWLHRAHAPMSLDEGFAETANGQRYDLSKPRQKRRMVVDGMVHYIDRMREVIDRHDPDGLVTMGWFAPIFGGDRYIDTEPLLERADLDFFDFHAYPAGGYTIRQHARSFGMLGYEAKPIIMGETAVGRAIVPTAAAAAAAMQEWIASSCDVGFDGWLNWGYHPWPEQVGGKPWTLLDEDGLLLKALAPLNQPDPCAVDRDVVSRDVARTATLRPSRSLVDQPARLAVDGQDTAWNAGEFPPGSLTVVPRRPAPIERIGLAVDQWPPGRSHHRVWATLRGGREVLVADIDRYLRSESSLEHVFEPPIPGVRRLRIETVSGPSWVAWREVSAVAAPAAGQPCLVRAPVVRADANADAPVRGRVAGSRRVLAEGRLADDPRWLRIPGDGWVRAGPDVCPDLPLVDGPALDLVDVTFLVRVPRGSSEVFLNGRFAPATALPVWDPATALLLPERGRDRRVTLVLPPDEAIPYLYAERGTWDRVERSEGCGDPPERVVIPEDGLVVRDTVATWASDC